MIKVIFPTNEFELAISREEISKFNFFFPKEKKIDYELEQTAKSCGENKAVPHEKA